VQVERTLVNKDKRLTKDVVDFIVDVVLPGLEDGLGVPLCWNECRCLVCDVECVEGSLYC
jgi:hypothetical protein